MSKEEADAEEEKGNYVVEEEPGKFRRIIASPMPIDIYEIDAVKALLDADQVVIAAGGGGIPVLQQGSHLKGASAIIEKDYTAAKLAELVGAGTLLFLTAYDKLTIGRVHQRRRYLIQFLQQIFISILRMVTSRQLQLSLRLTHLSDS